MADESDRLHDGRRIAQLLASELDGRSDRGLDRIAVTEADPDIEPAVDGAHAFTVIASGARLATVQVAPKQVFVELPDVTEAVEAAAEEAGLDIEDLQFGTGTARLVVPDGAAVKRAVPVILALPNA